MNTFPFKSGRSYIPLPIDSNQGFPQTFAFPFQGQTYQFTFYVNVAMDRLAENNAFLSLPAEDAFLVVRVERPNGEQALETIFLRKVVPDLEYEVENVALTFVDQQISRSNLNGQGNFNSQVSGGIAGRWA
jgi:hypothetical protein